MEAVEEAVSPRVRKQRSKRPRQALSASSAEVSGWTREEEEEDMANCLILLAQGGAAGRFSGRRLGEEAATGDVRAGLCAYECKTCSKSFPSFQALGGHRASHKKIKPAAARPKEVIEEESIQLSMNSFSAAEVGGGGRARVHECSMCGAEFSSGQALGGHMRRHRPMGHPEVKKERSGLSLDLNLPAPSEDVAVGGKFPKSPSSASTSAFPFAAEPTLLFSSSALVDCHY